MSGLLGDRSIDFIFWLVSQGAEKDFITLPKRADMSQMIGLSQQTVSRWCGILKAEGWIEVRKNRSEYLGMLKMEIKFTQQAIDDLNEIRKMLKVV